MAQADVLVARGEAVYVVVATTVPKLAASGARAAKVTTMATEVREATEPVAWVMVAELVADGVEATSPKMAVSPAYVAAVGPVGPVATEPVARTADHLGAGAAAP